jgi:hypothetical protein
MQAISLLSVVAYACALLPSLQLQVMTFAMMGVVRAGMYAAAIGCEPIWGLETLD